jgi:uncharacterized protein
MGQTPEFPPHIPALGTLRPGTVEAHSVELPGPALAGEQWPVTTVTGREPGPTVFVSAGVHGCEYPAIETVIRLGKLIDPERLRGALVLMPVVNLPGFRERAMFVCPVDGQNPNRLFPGDPEGSYSEQMVHALTNEFIARADYYVDLHGGDMVEALVPFSICRRGDGEVERKAEELARAFGLPNLLIVDRPVQPAKGDMSFVAAISCGVPGIIAEAGGVGQLDEPSVQLLLDGMDRVLAHLGMLDVSAKPAPEVTTYHNFEWLYTTNPGMFYTEVAVGDRVEAGQRIGTVGTLHGERIEENTTPIRGRVLFLTTSPSVKANGLLMGIGEAGAREAG